MGVAFCTKKEQFMYLNYFNIIFLIFNYIEKVLLMFCLIINH